ncbi:MAG: helix-turn-helix domain-containing protein [Candidatus Izemoplasmatales bacterium]|nr:helix-turn-helix domain-containing protein [Candidatus Izemoplasmatales bacterium]
MLYLAYGSNMNADQMKNRCPNSETINWGYLDGYKLVFDGYSSMRGGLVADIRREEKSKIPYVLWVLDEHEELALDHSEGFPKHYKKEIISFLGYEDVTVYVMTDYKKSLKKPEYYVSIEYEKTIRNGYREFGLDESFLNAALVETGNIEKNDYVFSITTALKRLKMDKTDLAKQLGMNTEEFENLIKSPDKLTFENIKTISSILHCSPKELVFNKKISRPNVMSKEQISKYFYELWFAVNWIVSIFYEKINYFNSNKDYISDKQKSLFFGAAHYYALILIAELWNSANYEDDDITFENFFKYSNDSFEEEIKKSLKLIKEQFYEFRETNMELLKRFKLSRDKTIVHITRYKRNLIWEKDQNNIPTLLYETEFLNNQLTLVINELVKITNKISEIINKEGHIKLENICEFHSEI